MIRNVFIVGVILWLVIGYKCMVQGGEASVTVAWKPNPEPCVTYRLWRGLELLGETTETRLRVELPTDQISTITCTAHIDPAFPSRHSKPLVVMPVNVHTSTDLRVWEVRPRSTFFVTLASEGETVPRQFFRFEYFPTP